MNQEFERRMQDEARRGEEDLADLEAKRAYLGGDADHSILVKGTSGLDPIIQSLQGLEGKVEEVWTL
jgi:hypothetical protein